MWTGLQRVDRFTECGHATYDETAGGVLLVVQDFLVNTVHLEVLIRALNHTFEFPLAQPSHPCTHPGPPAPQTFDSLSMLPISPLHSGCFLSSLLSRSASFFTFESRWASGRPCWLSLLASDQVRGRRILPLMSDSSLALQLGVVVS